MRILDLGDRRLFRLPEVPDEVSELNLARNFLTSFPLDFRPKLRVLDLSRNRLRVFPDISQFPGLIELKLQSNEIPSFPELVEHAALRHLEISDNPLGPSLSLRLDTRKLETLHVASCGLRFLKKCELRVVSGNFTLNLSDNSLVDLPKFQFPGVRSGVSIDLGNNRIEEISFQTIPSCVNSLVLKNNLFDAYIGSLPPDIRELDLSGNPEISGFFISLPQQQRAELESLDLGVAEISASQLRLLKAACPRLKVLPAVSEEKEVPPPLSFAQNSEISSDFLRVVRVDDLSPPSAPEFPRAISVSPQATPRKISEPEIWRMSVLLRSSSSSSDDVPTFFGQRKISSVEKADVDRSFEGPRVFEDSRTCELESSFEKKQIFPDETPPPQLLTRRTSHESLPAPSAEEIFMEPAFQGAPEISTFLAKDSQVRDDSLVDKDPEIVETSQRKIPIYVVDKKPGLLTAPVPRTGEKSSDAGERSGCVLDELALSGAFRHRKKANPEKMLTLATFATNPVGCNTVDSVDRQSAEFLRVKEAVGTNFRLVRTVKYVAADARDNFGRVKDRESEYGPENVFYCGSDLTEKLLVGEIGIPDLVMVSQSLREAERAAFADGSNVARGRALLCLLLKGKTFATLLPPKEAKRTLPIRDIYRRGFDSILCSKEGVYLVLSPRCGRLLPAYLVEVERRDL